ncbi:MAG: alpha/beta fold hydrolase BchO, partial [Pseudomonadota bacterium]
GPVSTAAMLRASPPLWRRDGRDWPHRDTSRFVRAEGLEWHVQVTGSGPVALLLHGAGGASHSWRGLIPLLAEHYTVVVPDLPGHGFTGTPPDPGLALPAMARRLSGLVSALGEAPSLGIGHSAGAAILMQMALDGRTAPQKIVGINPALSPFRGLPGLVLPAMARALHWNPLAAYLISVAAIDPNAVPVLIRGMGSRIDAEGLRLYTRLLRCPGHVAGTVGMMAAWDLDPLWAALPELTLPVLVLAGESDRAVPPSLSSEAAERLAAARLHPLPGLGHLAHEEDPETVAAEILAFAL